MKRIGFIIMLAGLMIVNLNRIIAQQTPDEINNMFLKTLQNKGAGDAYDFLYADNRALEQNKEQISLSKTGFVNMTKLYGNYFGFDQITKEETGKCIVKYTFILKYEKSPIKFIVTYYKPNEQWKTMDINFSNQVEEKQGGFKQLPFRNVKSMDSNSEQLRK